MNINYLDLLDSQKGNQLNTFPKKYTHHEILDIFFLNLEIKDNFELAEIFYEIHIISNYTLIGLISIHITAVIVHKIFFKENLIKKIL